MRFLRTIRALALIGAIAAGLGADSWAGGPVYAPTGAGGAPINTGAPVLSGTATVGSTLTCSNGTWSGSPTSFGYIELRDGSPISGATAATYIVVTADGGHSITCVVAATNGSGTTNSPPSNPIAIPGAPINTGAPVLTGTATVGSTLTCSNGTWSGSPSSFAYQDRRDAVNIPGATAATYIVVTADQGHSITCVVAATNGSGTTTSPPSNPIAIPGGAITAVQATAFHVCNSTSTCSQTITGVGAGHLLVIPVQLIDGLANRDVSGVTDNGVACAHATFSFGGRPTLATWATTFWFCENAPSGSNAIVVTYTATIQTNGLCISEFAGTKTSGSDAGIGAGGYTGGTTSVSATANGPYSQNGALLVASYDNSASGDIGSTPTFLSDGCVAYTVATTSGVTQTVTYNFPSSEEVSLAIATFNHP